MQKEIRHTWLLQHPKEKVWECLTKAELMNKWLMNNDFETVVGHKFMFRSKPVPQLDFDGNVFCEVLEIVPYKFLSYSWKGGAGDGAINVDTLVKWTLTPKGDATELLLEHTGFKEPLNSNIYAAMNKGWDDNISKKVTALLNTNDDEPGCH